MNKKRILKFLSVFLTHPITKAVFCFIGIAIVLTVYSLLTPEISTREKFVELLKNEATVSVLVAVLGTLILSAIMRACNRYLEESLKIEDDHHKIIRSYNGHSKEAVDTSKNFDASHDPAAPDPASQGRYMYLKNVEKTKPVNKVLDLYSKEYRENEKEIEEFTKAEPTLYLPSLNLFTNIDGKTRICFQDRNEVHQLPVFIIRMATNLLAAHQTSRIKNNSTIRLNDLSYDEQNGILTLDTMRSFYFHMLISNRCMDYDFANGLTLRSVYEYDNTITPLSASRLSNQIGINGMILTKDGYALIEKRGNDKTTWKDKFAQPISLSFKRSALQDLFDAENKEDPVTRKKPSDTFQSILQDGNNLTINSAEDKENVGRAAENVFKKIIQKTIRDNFGIDLLDYTDFSIQNNFLGVARDLLEGGKPNLYFYVKLNKESKELVPLLEKVAGKSLKDIEKAHEKKGDAQKQEPIQNLNTENAEQETDRIIVDEDFKPIATNKLLGDYYMVPFDDLKISYDYSLCINRRHCVKIRRKLSPRYPVLVSFWENLTNKVGSFFEPKYRRECGEALLATLSFLELCSKRIDPAGNAYKAEQLKKEKQKRNQKKAIRSK